MHADGGGGWTYGNTTNKQACLTHDGESRDGPVPAGVVLFRRRVVVKVAVLEDGEDVVGAVEAGAVVAGVALVAVVAAGTLKHPPPVVIAAPTVSQPNQKPKTEENKLKSQGRCCTCGGS